MRKVIVRSVWVVAPAAIRAWIGHVVDDTGGPSDSRNDVAKLADCPRRANPKRRSLRRIKGIGQGKSPLSVRDSGRTWDFLLHLGGTVAKCNHSIQRKFGASL